MITYDSYLCIYPSVYSYQHLKLSKLMIRKLPFGICSELAEYGRFQNIEENYFSVMGDNICEFLFALLHAKPLLKRGSTL